MSENWKQKWGLRLHQYGAPRQKVGARAPSPLPSTDAYQFKFKLFEFSSKSHACMNVGLLMYVWMDADMKQSVSDDY